MIRRLLREFIIFCFHVSSILMRHRPHLKGLEHLKKIPTPIIFTPTHDSYFEIPSLSRVYYSLRPKPDFVVLAKEDFLSGKYLSTNFCQKNRFMKFILAILDRTMLPLLVFKIMRLTTIHRPFAQTYATKRELLKKEIGSQLNRVRDNISRGLSTLVFPEGTTWGFGGLKRIRSSVYQLVENTFQSARQKVHVLPINVKVDRLVKGKKDIFINIGRPVFFRNTKEEFNNRLSHILKQLHTITFSQIAAYYLRLLAEREKNARTNLVLARARLEETLEGIIADLNELVNRKVLPHLDTQLLDRKYLANKINRFIAYCKNMRYMTDSRTAERDTAFILNIESILSDYSAKEYRKQNPIGFHANELSSLGDAVIRPAFNSHLNM